MNTWYDYLTSLADGWELKISVSAVALFLSQHFGGGEWLLATIQYLVFADLLLGIASAIKTKTFNPARFGKGIRKITSVYLSLLIVGIGTHAVDEATGGIAIFSVSGATLYDLFVLYLITNELISLNRHLARFDFPVNQRIESYLTRFQKGVDHRIDSILDGKHKESDHEEFLK